ncbi:transposase [Sphingomonas sp. PP-CC-3G-468]|uniref:IS66 family transposase n=1 Tax=Sphingomonas sp. PP-CC-3G-468 TaxID=2135656 RepID=UPI0032615E49
MRCIVPHKPRPAAGRPTSGWRRGRAGQNRSPMPCARHRTLHRACCQKSEMAKGIAYTKRRWLPLCRVLDVGQLEVDINSAERALRCV